jgi:competence protein ComEC
MLAVPVFDLMAVPLVLLGIVLAAPWPELAAGLFQAAAWLLERLWQALEALAQLPDMQWWQHQPPTWAMFCAMAGIVVLLAPRGWPARWIGAFWLLPLFLVRPPAPAAGEMWFTLLDVGQGLAAVVRTENHALVYDTGPRFSASFDSGKSVVVPYLRQAGVRHLDRLVVSHGDNDHAGGMRSVLDAIPVARLESSLPELSAQAAPCWQGERWEWGGVRFEYLNPQAGTTSRHNNASCVLKITSQHGSVLLTGDIEARAERRLVSEQGEQLKVDVLVAPHHGSKTSSTGEFLENVRPRHVLFPVGYLNRFHHPHPGVVERYRALGAELHYSPTAGAIELRLTGEGVTIVHARERERRYWHAR